ncbi:MAG: carbohydrate ABC transporter permease [Clostridia bacterium]|nr:carbohydrate ABC transporter permease [Clostridia bacterium]
MKVVGKGTKTLYHVLLIFGSIIMLYPFAFAFLGMFMSQEGFYEVSFLPIPEGFKYCVDNIAKILRRTEIYPSIALTLGRFVWYAFILGFTSVLGGYVFAKVNFAGKNIAFYLLMSSMMIPGVALLTPQYLMFRKWALVDNPLVLFITGCFSAYNIFLVRQTIAGLGDEYKEAAEIDGAGFITIVFRIYFPMLKPVLAVILIQTFIGQWNDYLFPDIFMAGNTSWLPIGVLSVRIQSDYMYQVSGGGLVNYPLAMVMSVFMMIPPVIIYIIFQKNFVEGLTAGGVKS